MNKFAMTAATAALILSSLGSCFLGFTTMSGTALRPTRRAA